MRKGLLLFSVLLFVAISTAAQSLASIESELQSHFEKLRKASNYGGSHDYDILGRENEAIRTALIKYGDRSDVLQYSFPKLAKEIFVTTSTDGRLRVYSWDSEEGGTMHDYRSVFQFRGKSGKTHTWAARSTQSAEDHDYGGFIHDIFLTQTKEGPVYLVVSTFIGSNSLSGQSITAMKVTGEALDRKAKLIRTKEGLTDSIRFEYDFFSVVDQPKRPIKLFSYDRANSTFRFPVVIEDQEFRQGRVTKRSITYRFDGRYFVRVG